MQVDWEPLPSVTITDQAAASGAPKLHEGAPGNVAFKWEIGDRAATDAAFNSAPVKVKKRIINQRLVANAMEPRACVARYDDATGELTLWVTSQNPHVHRLLMCAFVLGIPEHKVRVIAPDVGGGFGSKIFLYNEEVVCSWASRKLKRPIRWTASRSEAYLTDAHGRDHVTEAELALSADGKMLGLRVKTTANLGAYLSTFAPAIPTFLYGTLLNGVYAIPAIHCEVTGVFSNTTAVDAYRGAGRPEACYVLERIVEAGARAAKMDVADLRKKNFIPKFSGAFQTQVAVVYDSGDYGAAWDRMLQMLDYKKFRAEQEAARKQGRLLGIGFSAYIEACSIAPSKLVGALGAGAGLYESGKVRVHPTGGSRCTPARTRTGRGTRRRSPRSWPTSSASRWSRSRSCTATPGRSRSAWAPTAAVPRRSAAPRFSCRSTRSSRRVRRSRRTCSRRRRATSSSVVASSPSKVHPARRCRLAPCPSPRTCRTTIRRGSSPGSRRRRFYDPSNFCFPFGAHACVVEVERETGNVRILRYLAVDDVGNVINPMIVDGMVHGGIAQGVGQALCEGAVYDGQSGQLVTGSMMDYALPKADMLPMYETDRTVTPTPVNPMGIKGAGRPGRSRHRRRS